MREKLKHLWRQALWTWDPSTPREASDAIVRNFWLHWFPAKIHERSLSWGYSLWLGTISAVLFLILTVTGLLLMFFYVPSPERAYWTIKDITYTVSFGWLLRNQHRWAAHLMVLAVFLHMVRVFLTGSYRQGREVNWLVGLALLLATLLLSFTGYLLPWDQLAFWAVTVGTNIAREAPVVGPTIRYLFLGGTEIGQPALIRFYVLHVGILPSAVLLLVAYHMWRVRRDGGLAGVEEARAEAVKQAVAPSPAKSYSLFGVTAGTSVEVERSAELDEQNSTFSAPHLARRIMAVSLVTVCVTLLLSLLSDAPLEEAANPSVTPNPAKAPWYFLWLQELVAITTIRIGEWTLSGGFIGGIAIPGILLALAAAWPFLDSSPPSACGKWWAAERRTQNRVFVLLMMLIAALVVVGLFIRGPYWGLYLPWQPWPPLPKTI